MICGRQQALDRVCPWIRGTSSPCITLLWWISFLFVSSRSSCLASDR